MRVAVFLDQAFWRDGDVVSTRRNIVDFLGGVAEEVEGMTLLGRLDPRPARSHHVVADEIRFVGLPWYGDGADPRALLRAAAGTLRRFWRALDDVDVVWLFGPHPLALAFALLAGLRGRRVALGVRQDLPRYVANRHPGNRRLQLAARALERAYRLLARRCAAVVVGPDLARAYRGARRLLPVNVSLIRARDVAPADPGRSWDAPELRLLTVGRVDAEKNPLLLADLLARLRAEDARWRLEVCGDGPMAGELAARLDELGVAGAAHLAGYVSTADGLPERYRASHAFVHVSWTEGVPQVLFEAFAAGVPVVATAVGGVPEAAGDAALLVPPGDAEALAAALERLRDEPALRARLVQAGLERVRERTLEAEAWRVAAFLGDR